MHHSRYTKLHVISCIATATCYHCAFALAKRQEWVMLCACQWLAMHTSLVTFWHCFHGAGVANLTTLINGDIYSDVVELPDTKHSNSTYVVFGCNTHGFSAHSNTSRVLYGMNYQAGSFYSQVGLNHIRSIANFQNMWLPSQKGHKCQSVCHLTHATYQRN